MSTFDTLAAVYRNVHMASSSSTIPTGDLAQLRLMADGVDAARDGRAGDNWTLDSAVAFIIDQVDATTSVATLTYGFIAGKTLSIEGLKYLVAADGPNPNNLNSDYYKGFGLENRYINFACNLATGGEKAAFEAVYGQLSALQTLGLAYGKIFGNIRTPDEVAGLLTTLMDNPAGGKLNSAGEPYTRGDYFASFGGGDLNSTAAKAAIVGWLLAEAAKANLGPIAEANANFLRDLAGDGGVPASQAFDHYMRGGDRAPGGVDDPGLPGVTASFSPDWNVAATRPANDVDVHIIATDGNDTLSNFPGQRGGLDAGRTLSSGGGNDTIHVTGVMSGLIDAGSGNDTIIIQRLDGKITTGSGHDVVEVQGFGPLHNNGIVPGIIPWAVITDFQKGFDQLALSWDLGVGAKVEVVTPAIYPPPSLDSVLEYVSSVTKAGENSVFEYGRHTYIYHQNDIRGVDEGDGLIMLENATGLTVGLVGPAADSNDDIIFGSPPTQG